MLLLRPHGLLRLLLGRSGKTQVVSSPRISGGEGVGSASFLFGAIQNYSNDVNVFGLEACGPAWRLFAARFLASVFFSHVRIINFFAVSRVSQTRSWVLVAISPSCVDRPVSGHTSNILLPCRPQLYTAAHPEAYGPMATEYPDAAGHPMDRAHATRAVAENGYAGRQSGQAGYPVGDLAQDAVSLAGHQPAATLTQV